MVGSFSINDNLLISGKGVFDIKLHLREEQSRLKTISREIHEMKEVLEEIIRTYQITEYKLSGNIKGLKILGEYAEDLMSDVGYNIGNFFEDLTDRSEENNENVVFRIEDENTRNGFSEDYRNVLQRIYEEVPAEYQVARDVYDKYSKDVVVADFNTVDKNGNSSPYHQGGKLYLNTNADINNLRGDDTREIEKMKELMPETYEIYMNMLQDVTK